MSLSCRQRQASWIVRDEGKYNAVVCPFHGRSVHHRMHASSMASARIKRPSSPAPPVCRRVPPPPPCMHLLLLISIERSRRPAELVERRKERMDIPGIIPALAPTRHHACWPSDGQRLTLPSLVSSSSFPIPCLSLPFYFPGHFAVRSFTQAGHEPSTHPPPSHHHQLLAMATLISLL